MFRRAAKILLFFGALFALACSGEPAADAPPSKVVLWAWERPEELRFADPSKFSVAFLAQTLELRENEVVFIPRRQPLDVSPRTHLIAVTRIETTRDPAKRATLSVEQIRTVVERLKGTVQLPSVSELQIDFDATSSEREFYKGLLKELRETIPVSVPISITALASWCMNDRWLQDLPVNDAIPMLFDIGPEEKAVREFLVSGNDWQEPKCRSSYGLSVNSPKIEGLKNGRTVYFFKSSAWRENDIGNLKGLYEN